MAREKPTLRRPDDITATTKVSPPPCPIHGTPYKYDTVHGYWQCTTKGCEQKTLPKQDFNKDRPTVLEGNVELVIHEDGSGMPQVYLKHTDSGVMMQIPAYLNPDGIRAEHGPPVFVDDRILSRGMSSGLKIELPLVFHEATVIKDS